MTQKYTPRPWIIEGQFIASEINMEKENYDEAWICQWGSYTSEANARLIAAAPELLDALEGLLYRAPQLAQDNRGYCECKASQIAVREGLAAIAKARGEA